ncbi:response regulator transcription factor [Brumimicrobium aurantiacum]|uniref:LuxR family transcriptional regulator n=1 Tax=Brumimicrobium aurantiacum TaxID=1737063 RepID=A0A3E1EUR6_9FLAO|nr:helix-turn-helix transcriptional regulator [Brumimicrobium aurantiacum]RFC53316.1 LuxR family transcriptional regulator [Brumimicrobium aurantiacum]
MIFLELQKEIERIISDLDQKGILNIDNINTENFFDCLNSSKYYITIHDVQLYRPIYINNLMKEFYGFKNNKLSSLDHIYYLKTMHTSTYATLLESVSFFKNQKEKYLNLTYKLSFQNKEWRIVNGSTRTLFKNKKGKDKYAITVAKDSLENQIYKTDTKSYKHLTKQEKKIAKLLSDGLSRKEISAEIFISQHTVNSHIKNIYKKLEINKVSELIEIVKRYSV